MQYPAVSRATPVAAGVVVIIAGVLQFTRWKAGRLACCRGSLRSGCALPPTDVTAWRYGLRLGLDCARCCANLMALLLVLGVMDLRAMAVVAAAITLERLAPAGQRVERAWEPLSSGSGCSCSSERSDSRRYFPRRMASIFRSQSSSIRFRSIR